MFNTRINYYLLLLCASYALLSSCANQVAPTGGPKDTKPPKVLQCVPDNRSVNFTAKTIVITFNKFVQLKDADNQVFMSPAIDKKLAFKTKGKSIVITLKSALRANTTYTINFGNAINDITEGNKLENFSYVFSTGTYLDSMAISGHVHYAFNNSTEKNILVMLYDTITDSVVMHSRPLYFTRTDSGGHFKLSNLKIGTYKLFALKDMNANYKYDLPNEVIGFSDTAIAIKDTLGVYELALFTPLAKKQKLLSTTPHGFGRVVFAFARAADSVSITPLDTIRGDSVVYREYSAGKDTVTAWLNGVRSPSIKFVATAAGMLDTGNVYMRTVDSMKQVKPHLNFDLLPGIKKSYVLPYQSPVVVRLYYPYKSYEKNTVIVKDDSLKKSYTASLNDSLHNRKVLYIKFPFKEDRNYHVIIPANSVTNIFGLTNDTAKTTFQTQTSEDVGNLELKITVPVSLDSWFVQVYDASHTLILQQSLQTAQTNTVTLKGLQPAKYTARVVEDRNHNGRWDTGDYWNHIQPEKVFQYTSDINVRANWDLEAEIKIP